jgi:hypothetical protein
MLGRCRSFLDRKAALARLCDARAGILLNEHIAENDPNSEAPPRPQRRAARSFGKGLIVRPQKNKPQPGLPSEVGAKVRIPMMSPTDSEMMSPTITI